ncbi:Uma2 family endonuclease [Dolichospermum circinale]|jgi:Uma2 family endonuclease|uniref:Uma2 family endonuclease n=1 Tax=Dolichospermum circinale TaxID=109265 RepID=UPI000406D80A|nr:Uma2 family endonuclease [Dolichospermum circinale]MBD1212455.1 Uma2 family endonuclease [Dolichospermum circinale Clear-D4]MDB9482897.1 Uma2 family endonuclease [Dolichospermum circinale CS-537/05]MDB9453840.1 Uma2 family endonuclease [Dolichospermum circinale CS-541/06]MDB9462420.1 Uma2 family endonuclease [Dolichospermum circinale CS-541/04]MDB9476023.1 Uma2 family endonuclease [Dolichospermum circinale CS-537/11]
MTLATAKRFTITEYHRLADLDFFTEDDRVELIKGEIIKMAAKGKAHSTYNRRLIRELTTLLGNLATLQAQDPIYIAPNSEPEPDIAILRNRTDDYFLNHPTPSDIFLIIEVADSSLKYDQEVKLPLYAEAGISDYWIFNLMAYYLECYSDPYQDLQGKFGYRHKSIILPNESVKLPSFPELILDLTKVFPVKN